MQMIRFNASQPIFRALKLRASVIVLLAVLIVLGSSQAFALGLGNLVVNSFLDEPLDLRVELSVDAGVDNLDEVVFGLASPEEFSIAGIRRPGFMDEIQFDILSENDEYWLRIFGSSQMREPILRILLRVDWDGGSILREYTALINSPVNGAPVPTPVIPPIVTDDQVTDDQSSASAGGSSLQASQNEEAFGVYGPVEDGETLSGISVQLRQAYPELGYFETLYVLYRDNESAFIDGNMNLLKTGAILKVSNLDSIRSMSQDLALQEFQTQRVQWLGYVAARGGSVATYITVDSRSDGVTDPGSGTTENSGSISAISNSEYSEVDSTASDEFRIGSADVAYISGGGNDVRALQSEMSEMESSLLSSERENSELRTRIELLEIQLESVNQLIALEDPALAALQQGLANPDSIRAEAPGEGFVDSGDNISTPRLTIAEKSWLDQLTSYLTDIDYRSTQTLGTIGAAIAAFFALLFLRRRRAQEDREYSMFSREVYEAPVSEGIDPLGEHNGELSFLNVHIEGEGEPAARSDEVDPLAEAEVYLAYGRDDQAVETLKKGLEKSGDRSDIRMKLLETYCEQNDVAEFERLAEKFFADKKDSEDTHWRKVVKMGRELNLANPIFASNDDAVEISFPLGDTKDSSFDVEDSHFLINLEDTTESLATGTSNTGNPLREGPLKDALESDELDSSLVDKDDRVVSEPPEFTDLMVDKSASIQDASAGAVGDHEDIQTRLDLAQVYVGLGDVEGAETILKDVMENGDDKQKEQATRMLSKSTS